MIRTRPSLMIKIYSLIIATTVLFTIGCSSESSDTDTSKANKEENTEVKEIISNKNHVIGVKTNKKIIKVKKIIVCAGAWTNKIKNISKEEAPIRPLKGQMICLKMNKNEPLIKHVLWRNNIYLVPRNNSDLIIGSTVLLILLYTS